MPVPEENSSDPAASRRDDSRWNHFLEQFKQSTDDFQFQVWGSNLTLMNEGEEEVLVRVPKQFQKEWLEEKHGDSLETAFQKAYSKQHELTILVGEEDESARGTDESPSFGDDQDVNRTFPFAKKGGFDERYTFDRFVVGNSNELAYTAARAVADDPSDSYNPLFIYGGVGLGKTHLLQAVGHRVKSQWEQANVKYMTAEDFTNKIIQAIRDGKTKEFKYRYRNIDMFLVDDIQFLANKEAAQEEFFHTFNELYENGKGTVFCSDRPPQEISKIEERLRSRFEMGLIVDIQPPDYETRVAILQRKADQEGFSLPNDVIEFIAENITTNIRALEGSLNRLASLASLTGEKIGREMAEDQLGEYLQANPGEQSEVRTIDSIQQTVAEFFSISISDLKSKKRTQAIALPRQIAMYLSRKNTNNSFADIGEAFGGRDHSTVIHGVEKIEESIENDPDLSGQIRRIKSQL